MPSPIKTASAGPHYTALPAVAYKYGESQKVNYTGTSAVSAAIDSEMVSVYATSDCYINAGANPTATTSNMFLAAGERLHIVIEEGDKVAAIQATAGGTLHITPAASI